jgi:hypothetical protein
MTFLATAGVFLLLAKIPLGPTEVDTPYLEGGVREGDGSSTATIRCDGVAPNKISCTVLETTLRESKVDPAEEARFKADFDKHREARQGDAEFTDMCSNITKKPSLLSARVTQQLAERTKAACAAKDAPALWAALRWWHEEVDERTCRLSVYSYVVEFSRLDSNKWRSIQTGTACAGTTTYMLSRPAGAYGWIFDTIRTAPRSSKSDPTCKNPSGETTETITYGKTFVGPRELHCRYWDAP